jgi:hypothetical protein
MTTHGRRSRLAAVAAVVALGAVGGLVPAAGGSSFGSATFTDPQGDAPGAPDITAIALSDDASGLVQVTVTATGLKDNSDAALFVYFDTDQNSATGDAGSEYGLSVEPGVPTTWWAVRKWDGNTWAFVPSSPSQGFSSSGDSFTVRFPKADIGNPASIAIDAAAVTFDAAGHWAAYDRAPDLGEWTFALTKAPVTVTPAIGKPVLTPAVPKAGKRLTVTFPLTRQEDGTPLTGGTMTCDPKVAGKVLAHSESIGTGAARLTFVVPKAAKGKLLKVNLTIRAGGKTAHTVATFRVK